MSSAVRMETHGVGTKKGAAELFKGGRMKLTIFLCVSKNLHLPSSNKNTWFKFSRIFILYRVPPYRDVSQHFKTVFMICYSEPDVDKKINSFRRIFGTIRRYLKKTRNNKGKAVPLQAWSGPEGSRKLRFPECKSVLYRPRVAQRVPGS